jgi:hypothetical protein
MKIHLLFALLCPAVACASSPFDGTWKVQTDTVQFSKKPDIYELKSDIYQCKTCTPPVAVKADGTDQKVTGHAYFDTVAVKVVDPKTIHVETKLAGKTIGSNTLTVSDDGTSLTLSFKDDSGEKEATGTQVFKRVKAGAKGSHAISGAWQSDKLPELSDLAGTVIYKGTGDGLQMSWNGQSYDAKFDGKKVLTVNDPGKTMVSLKRISESVVEETDSREGKVTDVVRLSVAADGKTLKVVDRNAQRGTTFSYEMAKQP